MTLPNGLLLPPSEPTDLGDLAGPLPGLGLLPEPYDLLPGSQHAPGLEPVVALPVWRPVPDEVAALVGAYTRENASGSFGVVGGYGQAAGRVRDSFSPTTTPSLRRVQALIATATIEVEGRVGVVIPGRLRALARSAATWLVVANVHAIRQPSQTDETDGAYRAAVANFRAALEELTAQARLPTILVIQ